jgi:hypothetical protein
VPSELELCRAISRYARARGLGDAAAGGTSAALALAEMLACVRFNAMPHAELGQALALCDGDEDGGGVLPRSLIITACLERIAKHEGRLPTTLLPSPPPPPALASSPEARKRRVMTSFAEEDDDLPRGVLAWLSASDFGPITIRASSVEKGDPCDIAGVDTPAAEMYTRDVPSSWVCADVGAGRRVAVCQYALRHGVRCNADSARSWELQGSNDGSSWTCIDRRVKDASLDGPFACHTWDIAPGVWSGPGEYRFIRLLQTSYNSSHRHFLVLGGFEVYGDLFAIVDAPPPQPAKEPSTPPAISASISSIPGPMTISLPSHSTLP